MWALEWNRKQWFCSIFGEDFVTWAPWLGSTPNPTPLGREWGSGTGILIPRMQAEGTKHRCHTDSCGPQSALGLLHSRTPRNSLLPQRNKGNLLHMITSIQMLRARVTCLHISFLLRLSQPCYPGIIFPLMVKTMKV